MTTSQLATPVVESAEKPYTLDATHRCDRCGAQAYVAVALTNGILLFCAHHMREHGGKIKADGHTIIADETHKLRDSEKGQSTGEVTA